MKTQHSLIRLFATLIIISALIIPSASFAAQSKSKKKAPAESHEVLTEKLEKFGKSTISSINTCILPSLKSKEVKKNSDGTYSARYIAVDEKSLEVSYKKPDSSKAIQYIGFLSYQEVEYVSKGKTKEDALKGPFAVVRREPMKELVKYTRGKWSY